MRGKLLGAALALSGLLAFGLTGSASASAPSTVVSMTLMNAANSAPMAGAHVAVFFMPPPGTSNGVKDDAASDRAWDSQRPRRREPDAEHRRGPG
jgi:hypothetical protein